MNVLYVFSDNPKEFNCSYWNCVAPANAVNKTGLHTATTLYINEFIGNSENSQKVCSEADIIIVERNFFGDTNTMMQYWKSRGKTILAIFDDAYDLIHPQNVSYDFWKKGEIKYKDKEDGSVKIAYMDPPPLDQFKWGLRIAKGIQVPSKNLAKDWSKYGNTYYVHNYINLERYENAKPLIEHDDLIIGWCGSMSHYSSFSDSGVIKAIERIAKKHKNVRILIGGDKRIFDLLKIENKIFQPFVPEESWSSLLKTIDIGLAPLAGEYDKRRSWVKALEYAILKIPFIATDYETYSELSHFGTMVKNGYNNWEKAMDEIIQNYDFYKNRAETIGYDFAKSKGLEENILKVHIPLYEKLIKEKYI